MESSFKAMHAEAKREADKRCAVYPDWVNKGTIKPEVAKARIQLMRDIEAVLKPMADAEDKAGKLF